MIVKRSSFFKEIRHVNFEVSLSSFWLFGAGVNDRILQAKLADMRSNLANGWGPALRSGYRERPECAACGPWSKVVQWQLGRSLSACHASFLILAFPAQSGKRTQPRNAP